MRTFELLVPEGSLGGFPLLVGVVLRGGEMHHIADRLDPPLVLV